MNFETPVTNGPFEVPDEWCSFAEMRAFLLNGRMHYLFGCPYGCVAGEKKIALWHSASRLPL